MNCHYYVTLPSDSSADYYLNNTVAIVVTKLPERIRLQHGYETAFAEIIYPHSWYNVDNNDDKYLIVTIPKDEETFPNVYLQSGYYEDGPALTHAMNHERH